MLQTLKARVAHDRQRDEGFTLVELMVVVVIIAVLLAIAMPMFFGSQNRAKDRSAQSSLRNTLTAAKSIYNDTADYTKVVYNTTLPAAEPSLTYVATGTASADPKTVSINAASATVFYAAAMSKSGTCFYIKDDINAGTSYASGATCTGTAAASATFSGSW